MVRRAALVVLITLVPLAGALGAGRPAASDSRASAPFWIGRTDLRECPSPVCGGTWVQLVNRSSTQCGGSLGLRPQCYVATIDVSAVSAPAALRPRLAELLASGLAIAKGRLARGRVAGFPKLATLVVTEAWPASSAPGTPRGRFRLLRDNRVRCVTTPCFSTDAFLLNWFRRTPISRLDLSSVRIPRAERDRARKAVARGELIVAGQIVADPDAGPAGTGRVLVASQLYVRASFR